MLTKSRRTTSFTSTATIHARLIRNEHKLPNFEKPTLSRQQIGRLVSRSRSSSIWWSAVHLALAPSVNDDDITAHANPRDVVKCSSPTSQKHETCIHQSRSSSAQAEVSAAERVLIGFLFGLAVVAELHHGTFTARRVRMATRLPGDRPDQNHRALRANFVVCSLAADRVFSHGSCGNIQQTASITTVAARTAEETNDVNAFQQRMRNVDARLSQLLPYSRWWLAYSLIQQ